MSKHFSVVGNSETWTSRVCGWIAVQISNNTEGVIWQHQVELAKLSCFCARVCRHPTFSTFNLQVSSFSQRSVSANSHLNRLAGEVIDADQVVAPVFTI